MIQILSQPFGLLFAKAWTKVFGNVRQQIRYDVLQRASYAYGLLRAADIAKYFGKNKTTVCEFGVASGNGLLNMISLVEKITRETGVKFRVLGFDSGEGLPPATGYKDHPEMWSSGDFPMPNKDDLRRVIGNRAEIVFGDIQDTVGGFVESLSADAPLGFVAIDVDIYTAAKSALRCLLGRSEVYNPAVSIYCDDVSFFFANEWCGELAAIREFNAENELRKIDQDRSLSNKRRVQYARWHQHMYVCHVLDHEARNTQLRQGPLTVEKQIEYMNSRFLY